MTCCQVSDRCPLGYLFSILRGSSSLWCLGNFALFCCATSGLSVLWPTLLIRDNLKYSQFLSVSHSAWMVFQRSWRTFVCTWKQCIKYSRFLSISHSAWMVFQRSRRTFVCTWKQCMKYSQFLSISHSAWMVFSAQLTNICLHFKTVYKIFSISLNFSLCMNGFQRSWRTCVCSWNQCIKYSQFLSISHSAWMVFQRSWRTFVCTWKQCIKYSQFLSISHSAWMFFQRSWRTFVCTWKQCIKYSQFLSISHLAWMVFQLFSAVE